MCFFDEFFTGNYETNIFIINIWALVALPFGCFKTDTFGGDLYF